MKLKLAAAIFALVAIPALAFGHRRSPPKVPKPTKADVQKVAQIISSDKAKLQSYCDLKKLYDQMGEAYKKNDSKTADALNKQADAFVSKLGPEYSKMMDGLEQVDPNSSEGKEFMAILSGLDKLCDWPCTGPTRSTRARSTSPPSAPAICTRRISTLTRSTRGGATLRPNQSGMHTGWFCSQRGQYGHWDHGGLHPTDYGRYTTTEAGYQAFAGNRPSARGRVQKSETKLWDGRRSNATAGGATDKSGKFDGWP